MNASAEAQPQIRWFNWLVVGLVLANVLLIIWALTPRESKPADDKADSHSTETAPAISSSNASEFGASGEDDVR